MWTTRAMGFTLCFMGLNRSGKGSIGICVFCSVKKSRYCNMGNLLNHTSVGQQGTCHRTKKRLPIEVRTGPADHPFCLVSGLVVQLMRVGRYH